MKHNKFILANLIIASSLFASMPVVADKDRDASRDAPVVLDEATGVSTIKSHFAADPLLNPLKIDVTMKGKTAYLKGQVDTDMQYDRAVFLASSIRGIDEVETGDLTVKDSKHPMDDTLITAKVKGALLKEALVNGADSDAWPFKIETKNGVVFIKGEAKNETVKLNALKTIQAVKGVRSVKDAITIGSNPEND